jgi:FlaA1/EpsC-like NDP-sugar epimerase
MPTGPDGQPLDLKPTLLVGAGQGGAMLIRELQSNPGANLWPVAMVDDDLSKVGTRIGGVPVLGTTDTIQAIVEREHIESIVIAIPSASPIALQRITDSARDTGLPVLSMPRIGQILRGEEATVLKAVPTSDLLGRPVVETDASRARQFLGGKRVLVTGAAGSIGREVVLQALKGEPATIYGLDINESDLYDLQQELKARKVTTEFIPVVASVIDTRYLNRLMDQIQPNVVFHAAAYKHVPLMEDYPHEAIQTNIKGTWNVAQASARIGVERFVLVSTDKAVRPSSVMGASKRIAEIVVRDVAMTTGLRACAVRFGNVLGSRGSVIPLFERQIASGGPVTITDRRMTRYFMTIPEAAGLIIEAGAFGDAGVIYMLDMGEPVKIVDVAERLISLHGKRPGIDIPITYSGLRPGEKLFEELSLDFEAARPTDHTKIRILDEGTVEHRQSAERMMQRLLDMIEHGSPRQIRDAIMLKVQQADGVDLSIVAETRHSVSPVKSA